MSLDLPLITIKKLAIESGYSEFALRSKIARGDFAEGIHFIKAPDGRIHFIVKGYLSWLESSHIEKGFKSPSTGITRDIAPPSPSHQPKTTLNTQVN